METVAAAFCNVYKKLDDVSVDDHDSRSLVIEAKMDQLEGRRGKFSPQEKLDLYTLTYRLQ